MATRDPYLDNAKAGLIVLVVVGHLIERNHAGPDSLYKWIYSFHMPAFVFISGYLSRSFRGTARQSLGLATGILVPYVVVEVLFSLERVARGQAFSLNFFKPAFAMWYLLALLAWRLMTPVLRAVPFALPLTVLVSVFSVIYHGVGQDLSAARILSFLPFFAAGFLLTPEHLARFRRLTEPLTVRLAVLAGLVGALAISWAVHDHIKRPWLYMYGKVDAYGLSNWENVGVRLAVLAVGAVMTFAFLAVIPRSRSLLTTVGVNSLYVYLLQALIVDSLHDRIDEHTWTRPHSVLLIIGGIVLALLLGTPVVRWLTGWLLDPFGTIAPLRILADRRAERLDRGTPDALTASPTLVTTR